MAAPSLFLVDGGAHCGDRHRRAAVGANVQDDRRPGRAAAAAPGRGRLRSPARVRALRAQRLRHLCARSVAAVLGGGPSAEAVGAAGSALGAPGGRRAPGDSARSAGGGAALVRCHRAARDAAPQARTRPRRSHICRATDALAAVGVGPSRRRLRVPAAGTSARPLHPPGAPAPPRA